MKINFQFNLEFILAAIAFTGGQACVEDGSEVREVEGKTFKDMFGNDETIAEFEAIDQNSDQTIEPSELVAAMGLPENEVEPIFEILDINVDGQVTFKEMYGEAETIAEFEGMDQDGNGMVTPFEQFRYTEISRWFKFLDADNDQEITFQEMFKGVEEDDILAEAKIEFEEMDNDGNEKIILSEFLNFIHWNRSTHDII